MVSEHGRSTPGPWSGARCSMRRPRSLVAAFLALLLASLGASALARPATDPKAGPPGQDPGTAVSPITIERHGDRLNVRVYDAPWDRVLKEVQRKTGIVIDVKGVLAGTLTLEARAIPVEEALRRLFINADVVFFYAGSMPDGRAAERLVRAWVFPKEGSVVAPLPATGALSGPAAPGTAAAAKPPSADEDDAAERVAALDASARQGDTQALRTALVSPDYSVQTRALELLLERDGPGTVALLAALAEKGDLATRAQVLTLLYTTGLADPSVPMESVLLDGADLVLTTGQDALPQGDAGERPAHPWSHWPPSE